MTESTEPSKEYLPINPVSFPKKNGQHFLGDECHQQTNGAIPVWVVTDMLGEILIGNSFYMKVDGNKTVYNYSGSDKAEAAWCITRGRITINRSYQSSTATITLSSIRHNMSDIMPKLPDHVARFTVKDNIHPDIGYLPDTDTRPLDKGDVLCIWCGYIPTLRPVTQEDLKEGRLIRRFVGKIDTLVGLSTFNQGEQIVINMRDFMAYLMDSMGTYNVSDFNPIGDDVEKTDKNNQTLVNRPNVIIELARRCIGHLEHAESIQDSTYKDYCTTVGGFRIVKGYTKDYAAEETGNISSIYEVYADKNRPLTLDKNQVWSTAKEAPFIGGKTRTVNPESPDYSLPMGNDLRMNIVSGRSPFVLGADNKNWLGDNFQITDRVPVEFIKMLSLQEPWPTEFFVDSRTGEYWYAPRGVDTTGLKDSKRFYRTYCVRRQPFNLLNVLVGLGDNKEDEVNSIISSEDGAQFIDKDGKKYQFSSTFIKKLLDIEKGSIIPFNAVNEEEEFLINHGGSSVSGHSSAYAGIKVLIDKRNTLLANDSSADVSQLEKEIQDNRKLIATRALGKIKQFTKANLLEVPKQDKQVIHLCQAALLFREESSVINFRTNIIVSSQPLAGGAGDAIGVHVAVHPSWLKGTRYACSYFQAVDSTIGTNVSELVATAMSYARYYGKELRAASLHILGDPSIVPGEAVQVIGSTLYSGGFGSVANSDHLMWRWDREVFSEYVEGYDQLGVEQRKLSKNDTGTQAKPDGSAAVDESIKGKISKSHENIQVVDANTLKTMSQAQLMCPFAASGASEAQEKAEEEQTAQSLPVPTNTVLGPDAANPLTNTTVTAETKYKGGKPLEFSIAGTQYILSEAYIERLVDRSNFTLEDITQSSNYKQTEYEDNLDSFGLWSALNDDERTAINQAVKSLVAGEPDKDGSKLKLVADFYQRQSQKLIQVINEHSSEKIDTSVFTKSQPALTQAGISQNVNTINFPEDPKTIWRAEAVIDKFYENPGEGYKTEIALISPF